MKVIPRRQLALAMSLTPGVGGKTIVRVLTRNDLLSVSAHEFLRLGKEALREEYGFTNKGAMAWEMQRKERLNQANELFEALDPKGVRLVTMADAAYPEMIEEIHPDPPPVLFVYGNENLLKAQTFTVLSSRKTSEEGMAEIERVTEENVIAGRCLVSGHDTPEYQRAAVVPLRWGAPRILVFDTGLMDALGESLKEEPFRAARLWRYQFDPATDLAVSTVNPSSGYHRQSNKIRDGLVGSLSRRIDGIEIRPGGNMFEIVKRALRAGRPVRMSERSGAFAALCEWGASPL